MPSLSVARPNSNLVSAMRIPRSAAMPRAVCRSRARESPACSPNAPQPPTACGSPVNLVVTYVALVAGLKSGGSRRSASRKPSGNAHRQSAVLPISNHSDPDNTAHDALDWKDRRAAAQHARPRSPSPGHAAAELRGRSPSVGRYHMVVDPGRELPHHHAVICVSTTPFVGMSPHHDVESADPSSRPA